MRSLLLATLALGCAEPPPSDPAPPERSDASCPPEGHPGLDVGDTVRDLPVADCGGAPGSLHDHCGRAVLVLNIYGWCLPCIDELELAAELAAEHGDALAIVPVLTEDPLGNPPDVAYCAGISSTYGVPAVLDDERRLDAYGGPGLALVLDAEARVTLKRTDATDAVIAAAVEAALP